MKVSKTCLHRNASCIFFWGGVYVWCFPRTFSKPLATLLCLRRCLVVVFQHTSYVLCGGFDVCAASIVCL
jgi:hypothetical protein